MLKLLGKLVKFIGVCFIGLIIVGACVGGEDGDTSSDSGSSVQETVVEKYNITEVSGNTSYGITTITGNLTANRDYEYLQIEIPLYDSEGNKVGTALANISGLNKGETWRFEAIGTDGSKYDINKAEVTGW